MKKSFEVALIAGILTFIFMLIFMMIFPKDINLLTCSAVAVGNFIGNLFSGISFYKFKIANIKKENYDLDNGNIE